MNKYKITKIINSENNKTEYWIAVLDNNKWHPLLKENTYKNAKEFIKCQKTTNEPIPESIYF